MDILQFTNENISVRIDRLVQEGLVERLPDPLDQRGVLVRLADKGLSVFDEFDLWSASGNQAQVLSQERMCQSGNF